MNILITGAWISAKENLAKIELFGHNVVFMQNEKDDLPCDYDFVEGVICNGLFLYHDINKFKKLKYIQLTSAGFDRVPMDYVKKHGIEIHNARGVYSIPMAEFALCGVLQLYKQSAFFYKNQLEHKWAKNRDLFELNEKTVCIVGCGSVGTECAKRFNSFGCRVNGVDLYPNENDNFDSIYRLDNLNIALEESDIVVLTLPLTDNTKHLINLERFSYLKSGAVLVNISRGAIVDTNALVEALNDKLFGAVIDVFEEEPLPQNSPLWEYDNVILTPHNSFVGSGNNERLVNVIIENLKETRSENEIYINIS